MTPDQRGELTMEEYAVRLALMPKQDGGRRLG
jgi:hypothetical protein